MRAAYVTMDWGVPVFGPKGCSIHVQEVARALAGEGVALELFSPRPGGPASEDLASMPLHALSVVGKEPHPPSASVNRALRDALEGAEARRGPFDFVYERYSLWSWEGMEFARCRGVPGLLEVNAPLIEEQARHRVLSHRREAQRVAKRAFSAATRLLAVSEEVAAYLSSFPGTAGKIEVIANGVNTDRFGPWVKPALPRVAGTVRIGFAGGFKPWHGVLGLAEAFARLETRSDRLLLVGEGPERKAVARRLEELGCSQRVDWAGWVAPETVPAWLAAMDVAVAPYPSEGHFYFSPLKLYEYMAAAVAVVASRLGQIERVIEHEVSGLLVKPGDVEELAGALGRLRADLALRRRLGERARAKVMRDHTWQGVAKRIMELGLRAHGMSDKRT